MSYKDGAERINRRYDNVIEQIKEAKKKYQSAIDELDKMGNLTGTGDLKDQLREKISDLDKKIDKIKRIKSNLLENAKREDRREAEEARRKAEAEAAQKEQL